jgi:hypothetical protein
MSIPMRTYPYGAAWRKTLDDRAADVLDRAFDDVIRSRRLFDCALEDITSPRYYFWLGREALYV